MAVLGVVDPVERGGYYRGPRPGTRWVGVRLRIANVGGTTYNDDPANDTAPDRGSAQPARPTARC